VKRQGGILAAAPAENDFFFHAMKLAGH